MIEPIDANAVLLKVVMMSTRELTIAVLDAVSRTRALTDAESIRLEMAIRQSEGKTRPRKARR